MKVEGNKFNFIYKFLAIILFFSSVILYAFYEKNRIYKEASLSSDTDQYSLKTIPDFNVVGLPDKSAIASRQLLKSGKGMFVHVWATWCAPCESEMPLFLEFAKSFEEKNVIFLLIAVNDEELKVNRFLMKFSLPKNVVISIDEKKLVMDKLGTLKVPETFLFSSSGKLVTKFIGPQNWNEATYIDRVKYWLSL